MLLSCISDSCAFTEMMIATFFYMLINEATKVYNILRVTIYAQMVNEKNASAT